MPGSTIEQPPRPPFLHRISPRQLLAVDVLIGLFVIVVTGHTAAMSRQTAVPVVILGPGPAKVLQQGPTQGLGIFLLGLGGAFRRRVPMTALALITACIAIGTGAGVTPLIDPFVALPMYQVASTYG